MSQNLTTDEFHEIEYTEGNEKLLITKVSRPPDINKYGHFIRMWLRIPLK